ncbi:hypothetical protein E1B28_012990 [Marasmius oreades]|uniref:HpcH/HpaI aldolase/citrate lyase domain-containing protein n=1 Tax=Marasmius oreades TaxID=181124 RepID=A0A9P7RP03_9AGAR|nr:uncharacterized protein E1B28_012990 [Marasmius oreades]KAG7087012.1 hypothetical protein E1B28_012990 [Marasmius oreades]
MLFVVNNAKFPARTLLLPFKRALSTQPTFLPKYKFSAHARETQTLTSLYQRHPRFLSSQNLIVPMSANSLIDAFKANKTTFGTFVTNGGFYHARTVVQSSPDLAWIVIDCEHGLTALTPGVADQVAAIQAEGVPALVRVPATGVSSGTSWQIKYCLDAGAKGVIVPMVSTPEKAAEAASDCRFPPVGRRGFGSAYGHTSWNMSVQDYLAKANDNVLCIVQIETKEGIENLEKIAAVDGVGTCGCPSASGL